MSRLKFKYLISDDSGCSSEEDSEENHTDLGLDLGKLNLGPSKKLVVLCLGDLLIQRVKIGWKKSDRRLRSADCVVNRNFMMFKRPFCEEFLHFCFERFEVGIWSSAMEHNTTGMIESLGHGISARSFAFVWDQSHCTDSGMESLDIKKKPIFLKELKNIWENTYGIRTLSSGTYSSANTLLIDTEPCKALLNPPDTGIFPHEYKFNKYQQDTFLGRNGPLRKFLDVLEDAEDVSAYVKENRIGQPEIQPSHPDWNYYKTIIQKQVGKGNSSGLLSLYS